MLIEFAPLLGILDRTHGLVDAVFVEVAHEPKRRHRSLPPRARLCKRFGQGFLPHGQHAVGPLDASDFFAVRLLARSQKGAHGREIRIQIFPRLFHRETHGPQIAHIDKASEVTIGVVAVAVFLIRHRRHQIGALVMLERVLTHAHPFDHLSDAVSLVHAALLPDPLRAPCLQCFRTSGTVRRSGGSFLLCSKQRHRHAGMGKTAGNGSSAAHLTCK